jgi:hypothetical protein
MVFSGCLIRVIGFISKGSHTALSIFDGGVLMGLVAAIRCLAMYSDAAYGFYCGSYLDLVEILLFLGLRSETLNSELLGQAFV